ncbi:MAG: hypothetical protein R3F60_05360 [bacterium]
MTSCELERLDGPDGAVLQRYPVEDQERETFTFRVDTRQVLGTSTLYLRARATNAAGLTSPPHALRYRVRNVGPGVLDGVVLRVIPGVASGESASNIEVTVEGLVEGLWHPLTTTNTSENGRFQAALTEGPLRLTARGLETGDGSFYFDEARGEPSAGPAPRPSPPSSFYDPELGLPATISPSATSPSPSPTPGAAPPTTTSSPPTTTPCAASASTSASTTPAPPSCAPSPPTPTRTLAASHDAVRYTIALACLAEQARGLGCAGDRCLDADLSDTFTALHLVEMYREDARDGRIDGRLGGEAVTRDVADLGPVTLPADPLRHPLASACARWLGDLTRNGTGQTLAHQAGRLQTMAVNDDERLFGPLGEQIEPRPFDQEGPTVRLFVEPIVEDADSLVFGHALPREDAEGERDAVASGRVRVVVVATDGSGVALGEGGDPAIALEAVGDFPAGLIEGETEPTPSGVQLERRRRYVLDLNRLPAEADGSQLRLQATAVDLLGRESAAVFLLTVDQTAPVVRLSPPRGVRLHGDAWWTNLRSDEERYQVDIQDVDLIDWSIRFTGERDQAGGPEVFGRRDFILPLQNRGEGTLTLEVSATDRVGRTTTVSRLIHIDRTPPVAELQATAYVDERDATAALGPDGQPTIQLGQQIVTLGPDSEFPLRISKIQLRLGPDDPNLPSLAYRVSDGSDACAACPHTPTEDLRLVIPGDPEILFPRRNGDVLTLPLHGEVLGLEPGVVPNAGRPWRRQFILEDLAGNTTAIDSPELLLDILPPPLVIEPVAVEDALSLDSLTFENIGPAITAGSTLIVRRLRITNPWPVPVSYRFDAPPPAEISATTVIRPQLASHVLGENPEGYRIEPGCLLGPDGQPDPELEAVPRIEQRVEGGRNVTVPDVSGLCCAARVLGREGGE